jgi:Zn-dependent protease with chaperone function
MGAKGVEVTTGGCRALLRRRQQKMKLVARGLLSGIITAGALAFPTLSLAQERTQTFLVSQSAAERAGSDFFSKVTAKARNEGKLIESGPTYERLKAITDGLVRGAAERRPDSDSWAWELALIDSPVHNAACLPGGKMIIYSGLIDDLKLSDDEVAAVVGHEIGHALREHGREKSSNAQVANVAVGLLSIVAGVYGYRHRVDPKLVMDATALVSGLGASVFFLLPNSREMELEADAIGLELAARGGYQPSAAATLWQKMAERGTGSVEFISTHPSPETRIGQIRANADTWAAQFGSRIEARQALARTDQVAPTAGPDVRSPALADALTCSLPNGVIESLAPLACTRLGGEIKEKQQ